MSRTKYTTPEERLEAKRASARRTAAKLHAAQRFERTPMEKLLEGAAYTVEERDEANRIKELERELLDAATRLNRRIVERLKGEGRFAEAERLQTTARRLVLATW